MIYTITTTLPPIHGGRTKSLLSRVKLLEEKLNIPNTIITTNYNANYNDVYKKFVSENKSSYKTKYENIYDWLSGFNLLVTPKSKLLNRTKYIEAPHGIEGLRKEILEEKDVIRYYDNDTYVLYRKYRQGMKVLEFEDFMSPASKKKVERWEYNKYGILHRKNYYSPKTYKKNFRGIIR
ncbi:alpha-glucosyltransferase N-terminal domain-containing protein [Nosocomiicoccus massiliensis]|uniref:alpha-glucosyltransferase N-terminal domain-containing protein n=1 Tax=Nosocomiicoccus massiliensis TaxID=1232430 RepID=UPI000409CB68|nr:alpha-glucosyltransferase N-terminal domain-containing protein [Nosocomiicoccus massiliensis]